MRVWWMMPCVERAASTKSTFLLFQHKKRKLCTSFHLRKVVVLPQLNYKASLSLFCTTHGLWPACRSHLTSTQGGMWKQNKASWVQQLVRPTSNQDDHKFGPNQRVLARLWNKRKSPVIAQCSTRRFQPKMSHKFRKITSCLWGKYNSF